MPGISIPRFHIRRSWSRRRRPRAGRRRYGRRREARVRVRGVGGQRREAVMAPAMNSPCRTSRTAMRSFFVETNYDRFTYNLVQYLASWGPSARGPATDHAPMWMSCSGGSYRRWCGLGRDRCTPDRPASRSSGPQMPGAGIPRSGMWCTRSIRPGGRAFGGRWKAARRPVHARRHVRADRTILQGPVDAR